MALQTLICEHGKHEWTREATRGRKPRFCPKHIPAETQTDSAPTLREQLHCEHGNGHTFTRLAGQRGRKPRFCPDHAPVKVERPRVVRVSVDGDNMETLHCQNGDHDWTRKRTKGKKPSSCPEHRATQAASTARPHIIPLAELIVTHNVDPESERVLAYIEDQVSSPTWPDWRASGDVSTLMAAYRARIRSVTRGDRAIMELLAVQDDDIEEAA